MTYEDMIQDPRFKRDVQVAEYKERLWWWFEHWMVDNVDNSTFLLACGEIADEYDTREEA